LENSAPVLEELQSVNSVITSEKPLILVTGHRRESFGRGFEDLCRGIAKISDDFPQWNIIYPVHLNPKVKEPVHRLLNSRNNIHLIDPLGYSAFVQLMKRAKLILSDSGGVQEEAPSLATPVLVLREKTERVEAVEAGTVKLVGTDSNRIYAETVKFMTDKKAYTEMANKKNPYGNGKAAKNIIQAILSV